MIEVKLRNYLLNYMLVNQLNIPVYYEIPASGLPDTYIVLEKTGGGAGNFVYRSTFAIQSVAPTLYGAMQLNDTVKAAMDDAITVDAIVSSKLNTDYNFTDATKGYYRYQAVYDLVHY